MNNKFFEGLETCFVDLSSNGMNRSNFPIGSAKFLDINYNILPFLCDLLKVANDSSVSPILSELPKPFDITPYTDFSSLNGVGDPRISLGETLTQTYIHFLPRVITQTEVRQAGGSRVIDNYICTADGTPIKESNLIPAILSLDLSGKVPYQYGAITVPPISATYEELMRIIDPQEVKDYVNQFINSSRARHAYDFATFIKSYFGDWEIKELIVYNSIKSLIVELKKGDNIVYLKYYSDVANEVGCFLGLTDYKLFYQYQAPSSVSQSIAVASAIPNYKKLIENPTDAKDHYDYIINNYQSKSNQDSFSLLSTQTSATSAQLAQYYNTFAGANSSVGQISSVNIVQCDYNITY